MSAHAATPATTHAAIRVELAVFTLAVIALSGAPTSVYTKVFGYSPPTPDIAVILPVLGLMIVNVVLRLRESVLGTLAAWPWAALAGLALASTAWSIAPPETFREAAILCVSVAYFGMCARIMDWRDMVARMWGVGIAICLLSLVLYLAVPGFGRMQAAYEGALSGVFFEKNQSGQFGMVTALLTLAMIAFKPARAPVFAGIYIALIGFVALTQSATALIAALLGGAVFAWVALMRRPRPVALPLMWVSLAVAIPAVIALVSNPELVVELTGRTSTLSGRIPIWQAVENFAIPERPQRGFGYVAYWSEDFAYANRAYVYDALQFQARHAHNVWLEARLGLGPAGGLLLLAAFAQALVMSVLRIRRSQGAYIALPVLVAVALIGLVEISPLTVSNWVGMLFLLTLAKMTVTPTAVDGRSGVGRFLSGLSGSGVRSPVRRAVQSA